VSGWKFVCNAAKCAQKKQPSLLKNPASMTVEIICNSAIITTAAFHRLLKAFLLL
jgi:hypothetical protein